MGLKLYVDLMSQPSRALTIFFRAAKVPYEPVFVALRKGEHKQPEFLQNVNRFGRVPVIDDNGMKLTESVAIIRYVAQKFPIDDHWYPKERVAQARVDEFLEWQHIDLRAPCANFFRIKIITPMVTGKDPSPEMLKKSLKMMVSALDNVEKCWLGDGRPYLTGDKISVADILAACEMIQPRMAGYNPTEGRPNLTKWFDRVRSDLNPHYEEANVIVNRFLAVNQSKL